MSPLTSAAAHKGPPYVRRLILTCALCLAGAPPAAAEWTLALFAGGASTRDSTLTLLQPADGTAIRLSPVHFASESFDPPLYYGYRVGYFPRSHWFGVEGEFVHLKVIADTTRTVDVDGLLQGRPVSGSRPMVGVIERFSITHGVNLLLVNVVARRAGGYAQASPRWIVAGRFGVGGSIPHAESTIRGVSLEGYEWGAVSVQGAAGAEFRLTGPLYVTGEYKLTRTAQDVTIVGGTAETTLVTHHVAFGAVLHLGSR